MKKVTIPALLKMKQAKKKIPMLTAYDYPTARVLDEAGIPVILVGDSLGMVVLGYETTIPVTMEEMIHHTKAVARGVRSAFIVADMPFLSFQVSVQEAVRNAGRLLQAGANGVKVEGGTEIAPTVKAIVSAGIPVMGHLGLTPQSLHQLGGYRVQGKTKESARQMIEDSLALQDAGIFSLVLECIPWPVAQIITRRLSIPTIGIGAGKDCDGQVLVIHDMVGFVEGEPPKHSKVYWNFRQHLFSAVQEYAREVEEGDFPEDDHAFPLDGEILKELNSLSFHSGQSIS